MQEIQTRAFAECDNLREIQIPKSVQKISEDAFADTPNVVIYTPKNSYAYKFAKEQGIDCKPSESQSDNRLPAPDVKVERLTQKLFRITWKDIPHIDEYQMQISRDPHSTKYNWVSNLEEDEDYEVKIDSKGEWIVVLEEDVAYGEICKMRFRAISRSGIYENAKGPLSEPIVLKTKTYMPKMVSASNKNAGKIALKWTQPEGSEGYILYRSEGEDDNYIKRKTIYKGSWDGYTDNDVKKGEIYYYKIKTFRVDHEGKRLYSKTSDAIKVKCKR